MRPSVYSIILPSSTPTPIHPHMPYYSLQLFNRHPLKLKPFTSCHFMFPHQRKKQLKKPKKTTIVDGFKCFVFLWAEKSLRYYNCKLCEFFSLFLHSCSKISHKSSPKLSSDDYEGHSNSKWITSFSQRPAMLKFFSWKQPCSNQGRNLLYSDKGYPSEKVCIDLQ